MPQDNSNSTRASIFDSSQVSIQSQASSAIVGVVTRTLTGGVVSSQADGTILVLQLADEDADNLKTLPDIGTSPENTFLSMTSKPT